MMAAICMGFSEFD